MAAYLRQFIARRCGIAANMAMPFPEGFINRVLKANISDYEKISEKLKNLSRNRKKDKKICLCERIML